MDGKISYALRTLQCAAVGLGLLLALGGCEDTRGTSPAPSGTVIVFGSVVHETMTSRTPARYTWVRVTWLRGDATNGLAPVAPPDVQGASRDGTFEMRIRDASVRVVLVESIACEADPGDPALQCCFLDTPTCPSCDAVWKARRQFPVRPGEGTTVELVVLCR